MKINRRVILSVAAAAVTLAVMLVVCRNNKAPAGPSIDETLANRVETQAAFKIEKEREATSAVESVIEVETVSSDIQERVIPSVGEEPAGSDTVNVTEDEVSEWAMRLMPNVEGYLNIRANGNEESEVLGKLYKGAAADILERGEEWTKITSGSVEGYVKNEYCVFDEEAKALANKLGTATVTAKVSGLRVRAEADASENVAIVDMMEEGGKLKVDTNTEAPEGWVAVISNDRTAYVSAEYVTVGLELDRAISIQEEEEAIRKEEEAIREEEEAIREEEEAIQKAEKERKAKEAAKAAKDPGQSSGRKTTQKGAVAATYDEVTLLGALIQCEAGGEDYEAQLGVGSVVMNRLRAGWAGSIYDVIYQSGQFTPVMTGSLEQTLEAGVSGSCIQAAREAVNGVDNVNGALYFKLAGSGQPGIVYCHIVFY